MTENTALPIAATLVADFLSKHGVEGAVKRMPASTRTAADAATAIGCDVAQIAKSVFFSTTGSDRLVLVVASGPLRISTDKVSSLVGEPVQLAAAQLVKKRTGYVVGGVPPVAHSVEHAVLIHPHLMRFETVWAAAGSGDCVFAITPIELQRLTGGAVVDVTVDTWLLSSHRTSTMVPGQLSSETAEPSPSTARGSASRMVGAEKGRS